MGVHDDSLKARYVEWYALPDSEKLPRTSKEWGAEFGVPERTLAAWRKSVWFRDQLELLYGQVNVSPDRVQAVIDAMHSQAVQGNTKAAELYMRMVDRIAPPQVIVKHKAADELSDAELAAQLDEALKKIQANG